MNGTLLSSPFLDLAGFDIHKCHRVEKNLQETMQICSGMLQLVVAIRKHIKGNQTTISTSIQKRLTLSFKNMSNVR
jgi:hypothetical protein